MRALYIAAVLLMTFCGPASSADPPPDETLSYRGFVVDMSATKDAPDLADINASVKRQLDIVADCGASQQVMRFFRAQRITLSRSGGDQGGRFNNRGIDIDAVPEPPNEPIVLHELLHAFHARVAPGGFGNPKILAFYDHARDSGLYPANAYLLKDQKEFFAVTASLYLFGHVDRPPYTRASLREKQPLYYAWLGQLFGVAK